MQGLEVGDIVTLGFEYNGFPADTPFAVADNAGAHECSVQGTPAVLAFKLVPLTAAQMERYREWERSGELFCFSLRKEVEA